MSTLLQANERNEFKNSARRKIREEGNFPAVVYGNKVDSKSIYLNSAEFIKTIRESGRNGVLTLQVNSEKYSVMLHDIQTDPLKNEIVHADFQVIDMSKDIEATVNVVLVGEAAGTKEGGVLQQSLHEVTVKGLPKDIPSEIQIDVTNLGVNDTITLEEATVAKNIEITHNLTDTVASILPPRQEEDINSGEQQDSADEDDVSEKNKEE
ncbi:50S ribosomal protein L25/general stress protein Ctc [Metabacillus iocasae]|uniref:Large ribosomal subunit protein bL25 n=1 Tax=Priestia iocasae TaxID=2291674 RepID=A0ABS2R0E6_9BACI|nr:50S ribosomal protein L25/general stress protein Ctc [Metabacillus iocasae]MBM7704913.1 large subunit ribosomal protein L25 [Metabacillus iocasae]